MNRHSHLYAILLALSLFLQQNARAIDLEQIKKELATTGTEGWIHGAVSDKMQYVFTCRNPKDFFDYIQMSLVTTDTALLAKLATFNRHDKVRIRGSFMNNPSPQKHIAVTSVELVKKYESAYPAGEYPYTTTLPAGLLKSHKATFLVHAIAAGGHILVVEYRDVILPVFVRDSLLTKKLSRNDVVRLKYNIQRHPNRPVHLEIDETAGSPVKVVEAISGYHNKPANVEGRLVMFPKSPEIIFNVFAVLQETKGGMNRQFTIVSFENPEVFKQAREAMQQAWDKHPGEYTNGRNKLISKKLRVRVKGIYNQVSANQANPQILISSPDDVVILED